MTSKPKKEKPQKIRLKRVRNETDQAYKKRVIDAERAEFKRVAAVNKKIDDDWRKEQARKQTRGQRGGDNGDDMEGFWTSERRKGLFGRTTGWHD